MSLSALWKFLAFLAVLKGCLPLPEQDKEKRLTEGENEDRDLPQAVFPAKTQPEKGESELIRKACILFLIIPCVAGLIGYAVSYVTTSNINQAACNGETLLVRIHLLLGADVNTSNKFGDTPLIGAVTHGREKTVILLLENGADPNLVPPNDYLNATPLHQICKDYYFSGSESVRCNIALMLIKYGANVNSTNFVLQTPLHLAVQHGLPDFAELLIDNGADINAFPQLPQTTLDMVENPSNEREEQIKTMLIEHGAMTFAELSKEPLTPKIKKLYFSSIKSPGTFIFAASLASAYPELAQMADEESGMTFLHYCVRYGKAYAFYSYGDSAFADGINIKELEMNALDKDEKTALDYAEKRGNKKIIEILKKAGAKTAEELKKDAAPPPDSDGAQ